MDKSDAEHIFFHYSFYMVFVGKMRRENHIITVSCNKQYCRLAMDFHPCGLMIVKEAKTDSPVEQICTA